MKIKNILVSQPRPNETEKSPFAELAEKYQFKVDFKPFIRIEGVSAKEFRQYRVDILSHGAVFLTSKTAVDHFFRICEEMRIVVPDTMKYFCTSESIANYLQKYIVYRKRKIFFAVKLEELITQLQKHKDEKILLPLSDPHKPEIPKLLTKKKFKNTKVVLYRSVFSELTDVPIASYDMLVYYSPTEIKSLLQNFPNFEQGETRIACFGPATVKAAKEAKLRIDIQAPTPQFPSMTMAIEHHIKELQKAEQPADADNAI
ncbi:MAG: uroporphyrinogen-III synthase [Bacteroidales bacterium]|nr:uroporphyrinogen-III synthase [Bacteroidales bacterium]